MNHYIISEYIVLPLHHMTSFGTVGLGTLCQANHNLGALEIKPTIIAGHEDTTPPKKWDEFSSKITHTWDVWRWYTRCMCGWVGVCSGLAMPQSIVWALIRDVVACHRGKAFLDKWASSGRLSPWLCADWFLSTWHNLNWWELQFKECFHRTGCRHVCVSFF